jgi:uncharacterized membrane protein
MSRNSADRRSTLSAKKAAVLGTRPRSRSPLVIGVAVLVLLAAGAAAYVTFGGSGPVLPAATGIAASGEFVAIPAAAVDDGKARYYEHRHDGKIIRYFVLKSADGVIRAAFDACDVCWPAGKGYVQDGDYMVCRNCGQRFQSTRVNEAKGGCNPAPIERRVENGTVLIRVSDLDRGGEYFDFTRKG